MTIQTAIQLVAGIVYQPGWVFTARDHTARFGDTIIVRIDYPARNSDRDQAPAYPEQINTYAQFPIMVNDCDALALYRKLMDAIMRIELHEAREFFRVDPTMWAPFHPHRPDGIERWGGNPTDDLLFGVA